MKMLLLALSFSTMAMAQTPAKDYGPLLTDDIWTITDGSTNIRNREWAPFVTMKMDNSPNGSDILEYTESQGMKGPKKFPFGKRRDHKVVVQRTEGKVSRVNQLSWLKYEDEKESQEHLQTYTIADGFVKSKTDCRQDFKGGLFGTKGKNLGTMCVTINPQVCKYIEDSKLQAFINEDLNKCAETFKALQTHQKRFEELSSTDATENFAALKKLDKKIKNVSNFYDINTSTLDDITDITHNYEVAFSFCSEIAKGSWFKPESEVIGGGIVTGSAGGGEATKK